MRQRVIVVLLLLPCVPTLAMTYVGMSHNAMSEFCENDPEARLDCAIDIVYSLKLIAAWYFGSFVVLAPLVLLIAFVLRQGERPRA